MLVLSRKVGEKIVIRVGSDRIIIRLCELRGDKARIGVTAPDRFRVDRAEVSEKIDREEADAERMPLPPNNVQL